MAENPFQPPHADTETRKKSPIGALGLFLLIAAILLMVAGFLLFGIRKQATGGKVTLLPVPANSTATSPPEQDSEAPSETAPPEVFSK